MRAIFGVLLCVMAGIVQAAAFEIRDAAFFCLEEFGGGITFDKQTRRWRSATFRPADKFVLKVAFIEKRTEKDPVGNDEEVLLYYISITKQGTQQQSFCFSTSRERKGLGVRIDAEGFFSCSHSLEDYSFNLKHLRFLKTYIVGYINGIDSSSDTPAVMGGTCTKIE